MVGFLTFDSALHFYNLKVIPAPSPPSPLKKDSPSRMH
jgi:hypothetical protein